MSASSMHSIKATCGLGFVLPVNHLSVIKPSLQETAKAPESFGQKQQWNTYPRHRSTI